MEEPLGKLDYYLAEEKPPEKRRSLWSFISMLSTPLILFDIMTRLVFHQMAGSAADSMREPATTGAGL